MTGTGSATTPAAPAASAAPASPTLDFGLTEQQEELAGLARTIFDKELDLERRKHLEAGDWADPALWSTLAGAGLVGVAVPEQHGGLGFGFLELALVLREQGRAVAPIALLPTTVSALAIAEWGTPAQQARWLPGVAAGSTRLTTGWAAGPAVTADERGRITGHLACVPALRGADGLLVPFVTPGGENRVALVDPGAPGVSIEDQRGINHEPLAEVALHGVAVDAGDVLDGAGSAAAGAIRDRAIVAVCALASGVAQEAVRTTAAYTTTRHQFGRPIGTFQAVGQRLADAFIDAKAIDLTMLQAASHLAEGRDVPLEVGSAKFWAADGGSRVGHAALHVHGGVSIDIDYPIHRYFLWAKQLELTLGGATEQLLRIGRELAAK